MLVLLIFLSIFGLSSQKNEDFRIIDKNGTRLNWYNNLYYAFKYLDTNEYWAGDDLGMVKIDGSLEKEPDLLDWKGWRVFTTKMVTPWFGSPKLKSCIYGYDRCVRQSIDGSILLVNSHDFPVIVSEHGMQAVYGPYYSKKYAWNLTQYPYVLYAEIKDFQLEPLSEDVMKEKSQASLLIEQVIDNSKSCASVSRNVKYSYKKSSQISVSHSKTLTSIWKGFAKIGVKAKFKVSVGIPFVGTGDSEIETNVEGGFEKTDQTGTTDGKVTSNSEETTIEENLTVNVGAYKSVKVTASQHLIKDVEWKYKAKLRVYGKGPSQYNDGKIPADALRSLLQKQFAQFDLTELEVNDDSIVFEENGVMKASMGLKSYTTVTDIKSGRVMKMFSDGERLM